MFTGIVEEVGTIRFLQMRGNSGSISIVANKVPGIRCAHCHDVYCAKYTRYHNDANMIAFGEKVVGVGLMAVRKRRGMPLVMPPLIPPLWFVSVTIWPPESVSGSLA